MIFALDTSVLIDIENSKKETLDRLKKLKNLHKAKAVSLFISYLEFYFGLLDRGPKRLEKGLLLLQRFPVIETNEKTAIICAKLRKKYSEKGIDFSLADYLIASQTIQHNYLLLTKDRAFENIEELSVVVLP